MAELKTKKREASVAEFIDSIPDARRRAESTIILELIQAVTGEEPAMWGDSMVGFGHYHYKYESGHEGDTFCVGFSPRKQALTIYLAQGFEQQSDLLKRLGRYKTGKVCLYLQKLDGVELGALAELVRWSLERQCGDQDRYRR